MAHEFTLTITFDADTQECRVTGPVENPELCKLGLELARRVIAQHNRHRVIVGPGILPMKKQGA